MFSLSENCNDYHSISYSIKIYTNEIMNYHTSNNRNKHLHFIILYINEFEIKDMNNQ